MSILYNDEKMTEREEQNLMEVIKMNAERSEKEKKRDLVDNCDRAVIKLKKRINKEVKEGAEDIKNGLYDITVEEYLRDMGFSEIEELEVYYFGCINKLIGEFEEKEHFKGIKSYEEIIKKSYKSYVDINKIIKEAK